VIVALSVGRVLLKFVLTMSTSFLGGYYRSMSCTTNQSLYLMVLVSDMTDTRFLAVSLVTALWVIHLKIQSVNS
jgi:hypothetical protein